MISAWLRTAVRCRGWFRPWWCTDAGSKSWSPARRQAKGPASLPVFLAGEKYRRGQDISQHWQEELARSRPLRVRPERVPIRKQARYQQTCQIYHLTSETASLQPAHLSLSLEPARRLLCHLYPKGRTFDTLQRTCFRISEPRPSKGVS